MTVATRICDQNQYKCNVAKEMFSGAVMVDTPIADVAAQHGGGVRDVGTRDCGKVQDCSGHRMVVQMLCFVAFLL